MEEVFLVALASVVWLILSGFLLVAYLMLLFWIIGDLFRNEKQSGWVKALWAVFLILLPFLTAVIYLIVHGDGITARSQAAAVASRHEQEAYIQHVAGTSPADQIAGAKDLLDAGTITEDEYQMLKMKALR